MGGGLKPVSGEAIRTGSYCKFLGVIIGFLTVFLGEAIRLPNDNLGWDVSLISDGIVGGERTP